MILMVRMWWMVIRLWAARISSLFTLRNITGFGSLSFVSGRDFERPTDADGNNEYVLEVEAVSGVGWSCEVC